MLSGCAAPCRSFAQFLFYSNLRGLFGVSKSDLTLVWDALAMLRT